GRALDLPLDDSAVTAKKKLYPELLERFSWEVTTRLFLDALARIRPTSERKKLAILCPSPDSYSSIGKYALEVHAELAQTYDIDYYAEYGLTPFDATRANVLRHAANYYPVEDFGRRRDEYDTVLYHVGNSEFHIQTIFNALVKP